MFKLFLFLSLFPWASFADTKGGGGGIGIACYDGEELASVELLDIYELRARRLKFITGLTGDMGQDVARIAQKIYKSQDETAKVLEIMDRYDPILEGSELTLTNDAFPVFLPRDCKLKQVANYYNDQKIYIDPVYFEKLNYVNKLALAFHEHIYAFERTLGVPDSRYTRTIVALAFSDQDPFDVPPVPRGKLCRSEDGKVAFTATKYAPKGNVWRFDFITLNGHKIFSSKYGHFPIADVSPLGDYTAENPYGAREDIETQLLELTSKINGREKMKVSSKKGSLSLSWVGTDPGDKFSDVKVSCKTLP